MSEEIKNNEELENTEEILETDAFDTLAEDEAENETEATAEIGEFEQTEEIGDIDEAEDISESDDVVQGSEAVLDSPLKKEKKKKKKKKNGGIEALRRRYGYAFVSHWVIGLILFFIVPLVYSVIYSFSEIVLTADGNSADVILKYVGLRNYKDALYIDPDYVDQLAEAVGAMFYSLPMIVALSLILAVLLNQKYRGRGIMRVIFFLPVIIESSVIVRLLSSESINAPLFNMSTQGQGIFDYSTILANLNLPPELASYFTFFLSNAVTLTWSCGIQIVLFLAGLQGIPESLYEVSKIEGANKWEEFWLITVPMLRHVLSLVIVYTMISMFTSANNKIMSRSIELMRALDYGLASAMLWFYFVIVLAIIGVVLLLYNKFCIKKWE